MKSGHKLAVLGVICLGLVLGACGGEPMEFPFGAHESFTRKIEFDEAAAKWRMGTIGRPGYLLEADFSIEGTEITFGVDSQLTDGNVPGCEVTGTYTWSFDGEVLAFEPIDDPCDFRESDLVGKFRPVE